MDRNAGTEERLRRRKAEEGLVGDWTWWMSTAALFATTGM